MKLLTVLQRISVVLGTSHIVHSWEVPEPPSSELTATVQQLFFGQIFLASTKLEVLAKVVIRLDAEYPRVRAMKSKSCTARAAGTCRIPVFKTVVLMCMSAVLDND